MTGRSVAWNSPGTLISSSRPTQRSPIQP
jgi:hypothetical protein